MSISDLTALQISKMANHILHVPGNFKGGNLEMTIVISSCREEDVLKKNIKAVVQTLKRSNEVFRNVRLNLVRVRENGELENEIFPLIFLQTENYSITRLKAEDKISVSYMCEYLKKFHARSKLILVFEDENPVFGDTKNLKEALNPFLKQKLLLIKGTQVISGSNLFMNLVQST